MIHHPPRSYDRLGLSFGVPTSGWHRQIGRDLPSVGQPSESNEARIDDGIFQGVPFGGFGAGSIGRTFRGDFARWHLHPGEHVYQTVWPNQFLVRVDDGSARQSIVLCAGAPSDALGSWNWSLPSTAGRYTGLFPRAWTIYDPDVVGVEMAVEQIAPILPHNYADTSYPVGVFRCTVRNPGPRRIVASIALTWQNLAGWAGEVPVSAGMANRRFVHQSSNSRYVGLTLGRDSTAPSRDACEGEFAIAVLESDGVRATTHSRFLARGDGSDLWTDFDDDGLFDDRSDERPSEPGAPIGGAVAATVDLGPGEERTIPFAVAWDFPIMQFGAGTRWYRRYTRFLGTSGNNAARIASLGLREHERWRRQIDEWQRPVLDDPSRPEWYKGALFNELYYLLDGGTAWSNGQVNPATRADLAPSDDERFGYLESFDYPFYETLDVRFYASFPLAMFWPRLENAVMRQFAGTIEHEDLATVTTQARPTETVRKRSGAVPHDLGAPNGDPWLTPNAYRWQDVNVWKDLNSKYVLLSYRDALVTGDESLLHDTWPSAKRALAYLEAMDRDGDGLPENEAIPDQTYDNWTMSGPSAYCGGLWIAALEAAAAWGRRLRDPIAQRYALLAERARRSFHRALWNGRYFEFDGSVSPRHDTIMADQLCGQWYAHLCGLPLVTNADHARSALRTVFESNVLGFESGQIGAVNGMRPNGTIDRTCDQSQEVWSGVTYALAALMIDEGLDDAAWQTAWGAYNATYHRFGLWFRTPEAWDRIGNFRAAMYMRPQAIWAIEDALRRRATGCGRRGDSSKLGSVTAERRSSACASS